MFCYKVPTKVVVQPLIKVRVLFHGIKWYCLGNFLSICHSVHEACQKIGLILDFYKSLYIFFLGKILPSKEEINKKYSVIFTVIYIDRVTKRIFGAQGKGKLAPPPPPIPQIMILKLSPPRCVISKESVQQKWIDQLWFRKQLSTCLFVWTINYNDLVHLLIDVFYKLKTIVKLFYRQPNIKYIFTNLMP